ncbi:metallophosphoesterase family protein [Aporhodopirellula aestuarii]|uniref:Serine/threonine protein phosphatase n=1 Tax=Aporhodopirellula aestuarii TaxID=2950107 RepID=A0ABT0U4C7_9BACT|nr:metallophosphoesterase family protein [Aporhodopirellula aestuarii]MCM2371706.1 serine/threonine protein phosphatase [Aporhodopirellula aestuarii]
MNGRLIAIGDIHGYNKSLQTLLGAIEPTPDDVIVTLGDYVDRGPDSKGVIDTLIRWGRKTQLVPLLGNHEEMMLNVVRGDEPHHAWLRYGGIDTLESYNFDGDLNFLPPEHLQFFDSLGDYFVHGEFFFTHAAYDPGLEMDQQPAELLRWHSLRAGIPDPHFSGRTAVVGHTANHEAEILDIGHLICLDTNCYGGGLLTAMELPSKHVWQSTPEGVLVR